MTNNVQLKDALRKMESSLRDMKSQLPNILGVIDSYQESPGINKQRLTKSTHELMQETEEALAGCTEDNDDIKDYLRGKGEALLKTTLEINELDCIDPCERIKVLPQPKMDWPKPTDGNTSRNDHNNNRFGNNQKQNSNFHDNNKGSWNNRQDRHSNERHFNRRR